MSILTGDIRSLVQANAPINDLLYEIRTLLPIQPHENEILSAYTGINLITTRDEFRRWIKSLDVSNWHPYGDKTYIKHGYALSFHDGVKRTRLNIGNWEIKLHISSPTGYGNFTGGILRRTGMHTPTWRKVAHLSKLMGSNFVLNGNITLQDLIEEMEKYKQ